jgi:hypothetical protein
MALQRNKPVFDDFMDNEDFSFNTPGTEPEPSKTPRKRKSHHTRADDADVIGLEQVNEDTKDDWSTPVPEHGYPKGLGHGPRTIVEDKDGKIYKIEGVAYEDLPSKVAEMFDRHPTDDFGNLRIWAKNTYKGDGKKSSNPDVIPYHEIGNVSSAKKFAARLRSQEDKIFDKSIDLSYVNRPAIDKDTGRMFKDK